MSMAGKRLRSLLVAVLNLLLLHHSPVLGIKPKNTEDSNIKLNLFSTPSFDADAGAEDGNTDNDPRYSWVIAVVLCVVAALISNFGTNLQKLAWNKKKENSVDRISTNIDVGQRSEGVLDSDLDRIYADLDEEINSNSGLNRRVPTVETPSTHASTDPELRNGPDRRGRPKTAAEIKLFRLYWMLGFACIVFGSLFDFAALAFGAQSVVAPLGSLTLVANIGFAQLLHGEELTKNDLTATGIILVGCVFSVAFASHKNEIADIDELLALYATDRFFWYATVILLIVAAGVAATRYMEKILIVYGPNSRKYASISRYHRFSYAALSGVVGAQSVLFAKSLDELLVASFAGSRFFLTYIGSYLIAGAMFASISLQIYWLNCGLAKWDALYIVPVFQSNWIVFSVIGGGVFYGEFRDFNAGQGFAFLFGITLTVVGVYFLSQRDVADETKQTLIQATEQQSSAYGAVSLDQPLLHHIKDGIMGPVGGKTFEYEVVFHLEKIGLSVEPFTIPISKSLMFTSGNPRTLRVWRVRATGPPAAETQPVVSAVEGIQGMNENAVEVGHIIVAINGRSVLGTNDLGEVLRQIKSLPRPITLRFRATGELVSEPSGSERNFDINKESGVAANAGRSLESAHHALEGVTLNPLLDVIHTWDLQNPSAFEKHIKEERRNERDYSLNSQGQLSEEHDLDDSETAALIHGQV